METVTKFASLLSLSFYRRNDVTNKENARITNLYAFFLYPPFTFSAVNKQRTQILKTIVCEMSVNDVTVKNINTETRKCYSERYSCSFLNDTE